MYRPQYLEKSFEKIEYWDHNGYFPVQRSYIRTTQGSWQRKTKQEIRKLYGRRKLR